VTRAEYATRTRQLCAAVNARRICRGKEPLREQHIMRVIRLALGPAPALFYPAKSARRGRLRSGPPYTRSEWAERYFDRVKPDG
jgi:hypothetical protein